MTTFDSETKRELAKNWFTHLRNEICLSYEKIEEEFAAKNNISELPKFERKPWNRDSDGGGGQISIMKGNIFEKVGVNISTVHGEFSESFAKEIPGAAEDKKFFATGISIVSHAKSPLVPAAHFNTRYIETTKSWFGGGGDLTPTFPEEEETKLFHDKFKLVCSEFDDKYYDKFKTNCDEYFYLKHRNEPRGVGGIFYDYLNTENFNNDFDFTKSVGNAFKESYSEIVRKKMNLPWSEEQKNAQLIKRGRYVEFNLLYDRGTRFGLMTGGNVDAILMSLPPNVLWP
jgi:coproporphyrinogen III oxidase